VCVCVCVCRMGWEALRKAVAWTVNGLGSSVGIVTGYGLDGPGIESRWGRDFPHLSRPAMGPIQSPVEWVPGLSRGEERPGRDNDPSPPLVPWSRKSRATLLLPLWAIWPVQSLSACTRVHFTLPYFIDSHLNHLLSAQIPPIHGPIKWQ